MHRVYGKANVVDISIPPPSFKPVSFVFVHVSPLYLKQPKQVFFFNPIKYILNIFYHTLFYYYQFYFFV